MKRKTPKPLTKTARNLSNDGEPVNTRPRRSEKISVIIIQELLE